MITQAIDTQNFELCLFRIAEILTLEIDRQAALFYKTFCENIDVYVERTRAINETEISIVTISAANGLYDNRHAGYVDGTYQYFIDVWTNGLATSSEQGDTTSGIKRNAVTGVIRAILEDPIYKTLGFMPGNIGNIKVKGFETGFIKKTELDADNTTVSRLTLELKASETSKLITAPDLQQALTTIKLNRTDFGYKYEFIQP
jgi:hypothetical protein